MNNNQFNQNNNQGEFNQNSNNNQNYNQQPMMQNMQSNYNSNQQMNNNQYNQNNGFQSGNNNKFASDETKNDKNSVSPVITIVLGIIAFAVAYIVFSGKIDFNFLNNNSNNDNANSNISDTTNSNNNNSTNNGNSSTNNSNYNLSAIQLGELKVSIPTNYLKEYSSTSQYRIYMSSDSVCSLSIITTSSATHSNTKAMIDSMLSGAASSSNGKLGNYNITSKNINNESWSYTTTTLTASGYNISEYVYGILKNNNYYAIQYQNTSNDKTCESYRQSIENTIKFN